jgi:hypothetical protein
MRGYDCNHIVPLQKRSINEIIQIKCSMRKTVKRIYDAHLESQASIPSSGLHLQAGNNPEPTQKI